MGNKGPYTRILTPVVQGGNDRQGYGIQQTGVQRWAPLLGWVALGRPFHGAEPVK